MVQRVRPDQRRDIREIQTADGGALNHQAPRHGRQDRDGARMIRDDNGLAAGNASKLATQVGFQFRNTDSHHVTMVWSDSVPRKRRQTKLTAIEGNPAD